MSDKISNDSFPENAIAEGGCYCKAVRYQVKGPLRNVIACHCHQCQQFSGSFVMASAAYDKDLTIADEQKQLQWFTSSENAQRGFCRACGSQLFWKQNNNDKTSIMAGSLDDVSYIELSAHIYYDDKAHYYNAHNDDLTLSKHQTLPEQPIDKVRVK